MKTNLPTHDCSIFDNVFGKLNGEQLISLFNAGFIPSPKDLGIIIEREIKFPEDKIDEGYELIKEVIKLYQDVELYSKVYENKSAWVKEKLAY